MACCWISSSSSSRTSSRSTCDAAAGRSGGHDAGVPLQVEGPAALGVDAVAKSLPALEMPVEVAVLQLHARAPGSLGDEAHFDLARLGRVGLDLPPGADVPADDHAVRRVVGEHPRPLALAAIDPAIE